MRRILSAAFLASAIAAILVAVLAGNLQAQFAAGNGDGAGAASSFNYIDKAGGWSVQPPEGNYYQIYLDPDAGPWRKTLGVPNGGFVLNRTYKLIELLQVATDPSVPPIAFEVPSWTDYHETILTPGWMWYEDPLNPTWTFGSSQPGLVATHLIDAVGLNVDWTFTPPAALDTTMTITKYLMYTGGDPMAPLVVSQYPTPEPSTIVLLAVGAICAAAYGRRRARHWLVR